MTQSFKNLTYILLCTALMPPTNSYGNSRYNLVAGMPDIYVTPDSEAIGHTWANGTVWDKPLIEKFYSLLAAHGDFFVMLDLGAQTGSFSLLAKYFPNSQWHAFEPIQEAATALRENLILNGIHNVTVYQMAAAHFSGKSTLKMPVMGEWGLSTIGSNILRFTPTSEREIDCIDLDSFVAAQNIEKIHFMKLDTEGFELNILRGAQNILMRDHPIMLMEYNRINMAQCNTLPQDIDAFLTEMGYEWKLISTEDILCIPRAIEQQ